MQRNEKLNQNISGLMRQIEEKEDMRKYNKQNMNNNEAAINSTSTVPIDFLMPTDGIIGGIPGIGITYDRKKYISYPFKFTN